MVLPDKDELIQEIDCISNEKVKEEIILLFDNLKGSSTNKIDTYKVVNNILNELFNPYGLNSDPSIPVSFLLKAPGKLIMAAISGDIEYSITDIVELTGLTSQYISQEIRDGRLKAVKDGNRWMISSFEAQRYIKTKQK